MKTILITPVNKNLGYFHKFVPLSIPVGVAVLAGYLKKHKKDIAVLDEEVIDDLEEETLRLIKESNGKAIIGISSMTPSIARSYRLAKTIKEHYPDTPVVFGGIHASVLPDEVLDSGVADCLIRGEGEIAFLNVINSYEAGELDTSISNLSYKNEEGVNIHNEKAKLEKDLDQFPAFPYEFFSDPRYDLGFVLSSRGCPFDCIFCSQRAISESLYRYHSTERVIADLKYLIYEKNQKSILFMDDYLTGNKKRLIELCNAIIDAGLHKVCSFGGQTRGDSINKEVLQAMKDANFTSLMFGVETASERIMATLEKKEKVQDNIDAIKLTREMGFEVEATFILGFPTETFEERLSALNLAKEMKVDRARFNNATPYPGTQLFGIAKEEKRLHTEPGWKNFNAAGATTAKLFDRYQLPYYPVGSSNDEIQGTVLLSNVLFYFNVDSLKKLFNTNHKASGKWFEVDKKDAFNFTKIILFILMVSNVGFRVLYYLLKEKNCRKLFWEGIKGTKPIPLKKVFETVYYF